MVWCTYCGRDQIAERDEINGFICCTGCGRVLDDNVFSQDVTFTKGADGSSQAEGNFLRDGQTSLLRIGGAQGRVLGFQSDSHEKTLNKGKYEIQEIAERLSIRPREDMVRAAHRFYTLAVERNFTRGRPTPRVAGACLYIVCRQENKPYMLIDFSDCLQTNVYVLGAVFLQLCQLLRLEQHPIMQKPVDPSLFIHRFADRLQFGKKMHAVANSALRLVASMKRDWMQTGRRPSGICGAALFIAAHIHGFERSKADVVSVVHICEATLKKRLNEFEHTESGSLTTEEFDAKAKEFDLQIRIGLVSSPLEGKGTTEILCEHKGMGATHFAHGLCGVCYDEFVKVSGGMQGGSAPPAFQRAEQQRLEGEAKKDMKEKDLVFYKDDEVPTSSKLERLEDQLSAKGRRRGRGLGRGQGRGQRKEQATANSSEEDSDMDVPLSTELLALKSAARNRFKETAKSSLEGSVALFPVGYTKGAPAQEDNEVVKENLMTDVSVPVPVLENKQLDFQNLDPIGPSEENFFTEGGKGEGIEKSETAGQQAEFPARDDEWLEDDAETLSDIDDDELKGYLHNDEEVRLKTIIWTQMNREYLEEQQAKQAAIATAEAARVAAFSAAATNTVSAAELAAAAAAAVAKLKKDRKQKRAEDAKRPPPETAADATRQMLASKKLSSKVNYSVLAKLFDAGDAEPLAFPEGVKEGDNDASLDAKKSAKRQRKVTFATESSDSQVASAGVLALEGDLLKVDASTAVLEGDLEDEEEEEEEEGYEIEESHGYIEVEGLPTFERQDVDTEDGDYEY